MRKLLFYILFYTSVFHNKVFSQNADKLKFKQLEFASYEKNKSSAFDIDFYFKLSYPNKLFIAEIYKADTGYFSFELDWYTIEKFNTIFGSQKSLKAYLIKDKLDPGFSYAGNYSFIALKGLKNKSDLLTYIWPFVGEDLKKAELSIYEILTKNKGNGKCNKFAISKSFLSNLTTQHNKTKNLPEKTLPPPSAGLNN